MTRALRALFVPSDTLAPVESREVLPEGFGPQFEARGTDKIGAPLLLWLDRERANPLKAARWNIRASVLLGSYVAGDAFVSLPPAGDDAEPRSLDAATEEAVCEFCRRFS